ncbi:3-galactosyl-N-acetylglucosaminide 4-alpha-L-fucosyltransferase FUT3-like isoform 1-T3 [Anomaloglossus baeobatrachus]|uniref:3-galactosyl-N-acetylglucosaminide 4-alpha-L-fucosyltransferase FUT3-like n=1 Tax=Anomaloglossus baeobatrachus TaxID=238106 RepID=UPI003F4F61F3
MILAPINQKHLKILSVFLFLFLLSFIVKREIITSGVTTNVHKLIRNRIETQNKSEIKNIIAPKKPVEDIVVLIWKWPWGYESPLDKCPEYDILGCKLTINRSLYSIADAVLIHHADIMYDKMSLPQEPKPNFQRWIWYNMEPPRIIQNLKMLDNLFNMTMTFRKDSDIYSPYGRMAPLKHRVQNFTIPTKSKLVAWVVSKWYPGAPRIAYYEDLKKHISIDVYGANHKKLSWDDFYATITQYKFYLAFENSIYRDYITEKLWSNAFGSWTVPIVLGTSRKNYERFVPGDAFIHVDDFASPKELASYLLELDKDDEKFRKYFNWRYEYHVLGGKGPSYAYCRICEIIRENPVYQVIHSIEKWFLENV